MKSLKDQLLKAGLTDKQSANNASTKKTKNKLKKGARNQASETAAQVAKALQEKKLADQELNRQRHLQAEKKAQAAQIKQLIQNAKIDRQDGETSYNFTHLNKVKTLYVLEDQQKQLARGHICIAVFEDSFELVPTVVANKIKERDESIIIATNTSSEPVTEDDPYADYQIPDDLMW